MSCYHAEIINLSLKDKHLLKQYSIINIKRRFCGYVKIYTISVPEETLEEIIPLFQKNLSNRLKKEWYITFHNHSKVIIIFRNRLFHLSGKGLYPVYQQKLNTSHAEDKNQWDGLIEYAKSLGIPDDQCDFLPEDFHKRSYI